MQKTYYLYGKHACISALNNRARKILSVEVSEGFYTKHKDELIPFKNIRVVKPQELDNRVGKNIQHQGIVIKTEGLVQPDLNKTLATAKRIVLLDQLSDAHNIGSILRSSLAFGVDAVFNTKDNSFSDEAVIAKVASGAFEHIPYYEVGNLVRLMEDLKKQEFWVLGLTADAKQTIREVKGFERLAIVLGAEGQGLRQLTEKTCDILAKIPISNKMESLNASIALAVALYELS
jgi:23S rRNA (guanosine2251-2'-O)-methyltransferase